MLHRILRWSARILLIAVILFMLLMSFDIFEMNGNWSALLAGFLIHNIPTTLLLVILFIIWKWETIGGILLTGLAFGFMLYFHSFSSHRGSLIIFIPLLAIGLFFIISALIWPEKE